MRADSGNALSLDRELVERPYRFVTINLCTSVKQMTRYMMIVPDVH